MIEPAAAAAAGPSGSGGAGAGGGQAAEEEGHDGPNFVKCLAAMREQSYQGRPQVDPGDVMVLCHAMKGEVAPCLLSAWACYASEKTAQKAAEAAAAAGRGQGRGRRSAKAGPSQPPDFCVRDIMCFAEDYLNEEMLEVERVMLDTCAATVEAAAGLRAGQRLPLTQLLDRLKVDVPVEGTFESYRVLEDDPREGLRGELGLRLGPMRKQLPHGTFVGFYRGEVRFKSTHNQFLQQPPQDWAEAVSPCSTLWKYAQGMYTVEVNNFNPRKELAGRKGFDFQFVEHYGGDFSRYTLCNTALRCGNGTMRINDPQFDPFSQEGYFRDGGSLGQNCSAFEVLVGGWPFLAIFLTRDVPPGEDLRYSYGWEGYWEIVGEEYRQAELAEGMRRLQWENAQKDAELARQKVEAERLQAEQAEENARRQAEQAEENAALRKQLAQLQSHISGSLQGGTDQPTTTAAVVAVAAAAADAMSADHAQPGPAGAGAGAAAAAAAGEVASPVRPAAAGATAAAAAAAAAAGGDLQHAVSETESTPMPTPTTTPGGCNRGAQQQAQQQVQQQQVVAQQEELVPLDSPGTEAGGAGAASDAGAEQASPRMAQLQRELGEARVQQEGAATALGEAQHAQQAAQGPADEARAAAAEARGVAQQAQQDALVAAGRQQEAAAAAAAAAAEEKRRREEEVAALEQTLQDAFSYPSVSNELLEECWQLAPAAEPAPAAAAAAAADGEQGQEQGAAEEAPLQQPMQPVQQQQPQQPLQPPPVQQPPEEDGSGDEVAVEGQLGTRWSLFTLMSDSTPLGQPLLLCLDGVEVARQLGEALGQAGHEGHGQALRDAYAALLDSRQQLQQHLEEAATAEQQGQAQAAAAALADQKLVQGAEEAAVQADEAAKAAADRLAHAQQVVAAAQQTADAAAARVAGIEAALKAEEVAERRRQEEVAERRRQEEEAERRRQEEEAEQRRQEEVAERRRQEEEAERRRQEEEAERRRQEEEAERRRQEEEAQHEKAVAEAAAAVKAEAAAAAAAAAADAERQQPKRQRLHGGALGDPGGSKLVGFSGGGGGSKKASGKRGPVLPEQQPHKRKWNDREGAAEKLQPKTEAASATQKWEIEALDKHLQQQQPQQPPQQQQHRAPPQQQQPQLQQAQAEAAVDLTHLILPPVQQEAEVIDLLSDDD